MAHPHIKGKTVLIVVVLGVVLFGGAKLLPALTKKKASATGQGYGSGGGMGMETYPGTYADSQAYQPQTPLDSLLNSLMNALTKPKGSASVGAGGGAGKGGGASSGNTSSKRAGGSPESVSKALANGDGANQGVLAGVYDLQHGYAYNGGSADQAGQDILDSEAGGGIAFANPTGGDSSLLLSSVNGTPDVFQGLGGFSQDVKPMGSAPLAGSVLDMGNGYGDYMGEGSSYGLGEYPTQTGVAAANGNDAAAIAASDGVAADLGAYGVGDNASVLASDGGGDYLGAGNSYGLGEFPDASQSDSGASYDTSSYDSGSQDNGGFLDWGGGYDDGSGYSDGSDF
jgi:hypothetical protein